MELTLKKTVKYKLEPYGHFVFKWKKHLAKHPHQIWIGEIDIKHLAGMPLSEARKEKIINFMKKHKTDVLIQGSTFYTISGDNLVEIHHQKLADYLYDKTYRNVVDSVEIFE